MDEPRASALQFAMAVVAVERAHHSERTPSAVGERIAAALSELMGRVVGPDGFGVLLGRSLVLAGRSHPRLDGVRVAPPGRLTFADDDAADPSAMWAAIAALLATFIELLAELIGEDLAFRLVRGAWPQASAGKPTAPEESGRT